MKYTCLIMGCYTLLHLIYSPITYVSLVFASKACKCLFFILWARLSLALCLVVLVSQSNLGLVGIPAISTLQASWCGVVVNLVCWGQQDPFLGRETS